jgi:arylformamidase
LNKYFGREKLKIIDISQELLSCKIYPGDPVPIGKRIKDMKNGDTYNLSTLSMCAHNGTHIDAPSHFIYDGNTVDKIKLDRFVGWCYVSDFQGNITAESAYKIIEKARSHRCSEMILLREGANVTEDGAKAFAKEGVRLIGSESQSIGPIDSPMETHRILLERDVVLLEGLVLDSVEEGRYFLSAAPLNVCGFDGAPCRAYLISE